MIAGQSPDGAVAFLESGTDALHAKFRDVADAIRSASHIAIVTHARADADAIGSIIALRDLCRALGTCQVVACAGDARLSPSLEFLDPEGQLCAKDERGPFDVLMYVDCAEADRAEPVAGRFLKNAAMGLRTINIDHHVTNVGYADLDLIVPDTAATAEIVVQMYKALNLEISDATATALLAGIYGDTLGLKTPSTQAGTMRACADLVQAGAHLDLVVDKLFREKPYSTVLLWGEAQLQAAWHGRLVWTRVTNDMLNRAGAGSGETEGLVNFLAGTIGAFAAALVQEADDGWRVSLRSTTEAVDVAQIAKQFGGGGHPRAAGCRLRPGEAALEEFLDTVKASLDSLHEDAGTRPVEARRMRD